MRFVLFNVACKFGQSFAKHQPCRIYGTDSRSTIFSYPCAWSRYKMQTMANAFWLIYYQSLQFKWYKAIIDTTLKLSTRMYCEKYESGIKKSSTDQTQKKYPHTHKYTHMRGCKQTCWHFNRGKKDSEHFPE